jgi:hypothetical protein
MICGVDCVREEVGVGDNHIAPILRLKRGHMARIPRKDRVHPCTANTALKVRRG